MRAPSFLSPKPCLALEKRAVAGLMCVLLALILLNVVTRYSGHPLYWVDESAVYAMVWLAFLGGSALTRLRLDFAVTLLTDYLPPAAARWMRAASTLLVLLFALALAAFCWMWMDPSASSAPASTRRPSRPRASTFSIPSAARR